MIPIRHIPAGCFTKRLIRIHSRELANHARRVRASKASFALTVEIVAVIPIGRITRNETPFSMNSIREGFQVEGSREDVLAIIEAEEIFGTQLQR